MSMFSVLIVVGLTILLSGCQRYDQPDQFYTTQECDNSYPQCMSEKWKVANYRGFEF